MLRNILKNIGKHSAVYAVGWMAGSLVSLIMLPIYTRYLTTSDYGVLSLLDKTMGILRILLMVGITSAVAKFYHSTEKADERKQVVSAAFWLVLASTVLWLIACFPLSAPLSRLILGNATYTSFIQVAVAIVAIESLLGVYLASLRCAKRSRLFLVYGVCRLATGVAGNVLFIVVLRLGVLGMLLGNLTSSGLAMAVSLVQLTHENGLPFRPPLARRMLVFGLPLVPAALAAAVMHNADRYLLRYFTDLEQVGIYDLGYKLPFAMNSFILGTFAMVWSSATVYEVARLPEARQLFARIALYFMLVYATAQMVLAALAVPIVRVLAPPEYFDAYRVMPVVALGCVIYAMHIFFAVGVYLRSKTWALPIVYAGAAAVNVAANALLIPRFGYMAAAWVTVATYAVFSLGGYAVYRRFYAIPFPMIKLAALVLIFAVLGLSVTGLLPLSVWIQAPAGIVAIALMLAASTFGLLTTGERRQAYDLAFSLAESRLGIRFRRAAGGGADTCESTVGPGPPPRAVPLAPPGTWPTGQDGPPRECGRKTAPSGSQMDSYTEPKRFPLMVKVWAGDPARFKVVRRSLLSLVNSDLPDEADLVVVDDANHHAGLEALLGDLASRFPRLRVWRNPERLGPNKGQEVNFARLVAEYPDAEFYINGDDDILYSKEWLVRLIATYREGRECGLLGIYSAFNLPMRRHYGRVRLPSSLVLLKERQPASNWLIPREVYHRVGPFQDDGRAYDTHYTDITVKLGIPIVCLKPSYVQNLGTRGAYQEGGIALAPDFVDESRLYSFSRRTWYVLVRLWLRARRKYWGPILIGRGR